MMPSHNNNVKYRFTDYLTVKILLIIFHSPPCLNKNPHKQPSPIITAACHYDFYIESARTRSAS